VTSDRSLVSRKLIFVTSDRTWPPREPESLASAFDLLLSTYLSGHASVINGNALS
jgi:hypothetical protein